MRKDRILRQRTTGRSAKFALGMMVALVWTNPGHAESPHPEPAEYTLLPTWCQALEHEFKNPKAAADPMARARLAKIEKSGCSGPWHFCWALIWRNRAIFDNVDSTQRNFLLGRAIADFGYILEHSLPSCSLVPDAHAQRGETYTLLGNLKEAEASYATALQKKPGYSAAFIGLSDVYEQQGNLDKSIEVLKQGIEANSRSSALKKKLKRVQARSSAGDL